MIGMRKSEHMKMNYRDLALDGSLEVAAVLLALSLGSSISIIDNKEV